VANKVSHLLGPAMRGFFLMCIKIEFGSVYYPSRTKSVISTFEKWNIFNIDQIYTSNY
jgi:hypothetical protein